MPAVAHSKLCSSILALLGVFASNAMSSVPSTSFLCQLEAIFSDFVDLSSKHVVLTDDEEVWG